jgi:DNA-binding HxlR family transcriptional regulator
MKTHTKNITIENVLEAIRVGRELFTFIANDVNSFGLSKKQYYHRLGKLAKLNLIERKHSKYVLTPFGKAIYQLNLQLGEENEKHLESTLEEDEQVLAAIVEN